MYSDIFSFFPLNTKTHSYCWIDCSFINNHAHSSRNFYIHSGNLRVYHVKIVKPKPENGDGWFECRPSSVKADVNYGDLYPTWNIR